MNKSDVDGETMRWQLGLTPSFTETHIDRFTV